MDQHKNQIQEFEDKIISLQREKNQLEDDLKMEQDRQSIVLERQGGLNQETDVRPELQENFESKVEHVRVHGPETILSSSNLVTFSHVPFVTDSLFEGQRDETTSTHVVSLQCDIPREHLETSKRVPSLDVADVDYPPRPAIRDKGRMKRDMLFGGGSNENASTSHVSVQCDILRGQLETSERVSCLDVVDYPPRPAIRDKGRMKRDMLFGGGSNENASTSHVSVQCDILRGQLETSERVSCHDVADPCYYQTPAILKKRRIKRNPFEFNEISSSISTIESKMGLSSSMMEERQLTLSVKKNLFRKSEFFDLEVKVNEDTDELGFDPSQTTASNLSDFIVEGEPSCNSKLVYNQYPSNSPNVRIGKLDINKLAEKYEASRASSCGHPKKRRKLYISSSSDSD